MTKTIFLIFKLLFSFVSSVSLLQIQSTLLPLNSYHVTFSPEFIYNIKAQTLCGIIKNCYIWYHDNLVTPAGFSALGLSFNNINLRQHSICIDFMRKMNGCFMQFPQTHRNEGIKDTEIFDFCNLNNNQQNKFVRILQYIVIAVMS